MKVAGKIAIVTGGGRGIGRAIALKLSEEGASVVVNDLEKSLADSIAEKIERSGQVALPIKADVSDREE